MDELITARFIENERRIANTEMDLKELRKELSDISKDYNEKYNKLDKSNELIAIQLSVINKQLERLDEKTDQLLATNGEGVLNQDKAKKWDKMIWLVIGEAVAILGLIIKIFLGIKG